jgi:hypothetical protein
MPAPSDEIMRSVTPNLTDGVLLRREANVSAMLSQWSAQQTEMRL